jgi:hypothetical protein
MASASSRRISKQSKNPQDPSIPRPTGEIKMEAPAQANNIATNMENMTDNVVPTKGESVGLVGQSTGANAIANGPRDSNYSDLVSSGGPMDIIKKNTGTAFTMRESMYKK